MEDRPKISTTNELIEDVRARQSNTVWPDALQNSRNVDGFLWKGAPNAPLVQRIGAWIFGLTFILLGVAIACIAYEKREDAWPIGAFSVVILMIGGRVFLNGFRRDKGTESSSE